MLLQRLEYFVAWTTFTPLGQALRDRFEQQDELNVARELWAMNSLGQLRHIELKPAIRLAIAILLEESPRPIDTCDKLRRTPDTPQQREQLAQ